MYCKGSLGINRGIRSTSSRGLVIPRLGGSGRIAGELVRCTPSRDFSANTDSFVIQTALRPYLWMLVGSLAFAWMGIWGHEAGAVFSWQLVAIVRCSMPLVIMAILALAAGAKLVFFRPPVLWMRSLSGSFSLIGVFFALPLMSVADIFTFTSIYPIWVALLSWPILGEAPTPAVWLSVLSGVFGVALIERSDLGGTNYVALIPLGVSVFTALAMMGLNQLKDIDPRAVVVHFSMVALSFAIAAFFLFRRKPTRDTALLWPVAELIGMGLMATIGQLCLTMAFTRGNAARVSVVGLMQVVFTLILEPIVLGHAFDVIKLVGVPLVIAPAAWLMLRGRPGPSAEQLTVS